MKHTILKMATVASMASALACTPQKAEFHYLIDEFADLKIMRYKVPGWEDLSIGQKEYM